MSGLGVVVIGRNEGDLLVRCLASVADAGAAVVYVDSGSSDGSVERARSLGAEVVELDTRVPFTAARARNAGFQRLEALSGSSPVELVQFVDGDCEVRTGWIDTARRHLEQHADVAVVCGRRRERHPEASPWNQLIDIEWDTPVGDALACGGDALVRAALFRRVGGYNDALIAGEDPDLCMRIRAAGSRIVRLDHEMTWHDARLTRFGQWWTRSSRAGHAYAESVHLHGLGNDRGTGRRLASILFWGALLPLAALAAAPATAGASLLLLLGYGVLALRIQRAMRSRGFPPPLSRLYALGCIGGKFAEVTGVLRFAWNRLVRRRASTLIEYKGQPPRAPN